MDFMTFTLNTPMFDFLVLSIIAEGDAYGYQISQIIKRVSDTKDSALYPILKKLQENGYVETYDQQFQGRNRKYYKITQSGKIRGTLDNMIFTSAVGELRGVFGVMIGQIAKAYGIDVEDELADIIPE